MLRVLALALALVAVCVGSAAEARRSSKTAKSQTSAEGAAPSASGTAPAESRVTPLGPASAPPADSRVAASAASPLASAAGPSTSSPADAAQASPSGTAPAITAPPPRNKAELDAALAEASVLFKQGQHVEAADKLLWIYSASPQPIYLFNAGQAYRRAKRPSQAKAAYVRFVDAAPSHPLVPEVRGYLRDLQTLEEMQQHEQQISLQLQQERADATVARQALQQERSTPIYKRPLFWGVLAGVGLALVAGGVAGSFMWSRVAADSRVEIAR